MLGLGEALIRERFNDDGFFCFGANVRCVFIALKLVSSEKFTARIIKMCQQ